MVITISAEVQTDIKSIWQAWTDEYHMQKWFFASEDWFCPKAISDLQEGGEFSVIFAEKHSSKKFPFNGTYTSIIEYQFIEYYTEDGRNVKTYFIEGEEIVLIRQEIEPEMSNPLEVQTQGWEFILSNFKTYSEGL